MIEYKQIVFPAVLQYFAREVAASLIDADKKQLRFNDIIRVAELFYNDPYIGIHDLILSCDKNDPAYVEKRPMWQVLETEYRWMIE